MPSKKSLARVGMSFHEEELEALNKVLAAAEMKRDVSRLVLGKEYLLARGKLIRSLRTVRGKKECAA